MRYQKTRDFPKREQKVQYNEEAIRRHKQNHIGWFVIISNKTKDATEALRSYRQKDVIEKGFDDLKNDLDMRRLGIHSNTSMEGRIFIQFVLLILTTCLKGMVVESIYQHTYHCWNTR